MSQTPAPPEAPSNQDFGPPPEFESNESIFDTPEAESIVSAAKKSGAVVTAMPLVPSTPTAPAAPTAPQPGTPTEDRPFVKMATVLYRPDQLDEKGDVAVAHWVSVEVSQKAGGKAVTTEFEEVMRDLYMRGYTAKPPSTSPTMSYSPGASSPSQASAPVIPPPNRPTGSPQAASNPPAPVQPNAQRAAGGSSDTGTDTLHKIQVMPDGKVEFYVGQFKYPFKDSRFAPSSRFDVPSLVNQVFDASLGITQQTIQTPSLINCEGHNLVVDWEKVERNAKTYYNVVRVRRA